MRIIHLIDTLDIGGAEQVVASLASCQSRRGHSVRVVCLRDLGPNPVDVTSLAKAGVAIVTLEKPQGFHYGTLCKLVSYLKAQKVDVVHTHNHIVHHYGAVAARWAQTPAVVNTLHGTSSLRMAPWAKALFWLSCIIGDRVVSVCPQVNSDFQKSFHLPRKKLCVVENGIELSGFLAIPNRAVGKEFIFGNIGRFDPVKDHENLLRAFAILRKRHSNVQLRLLGDGMLRHYIEDLAKTLSIADYVHFEGFSLETARFLNSIDIYVISSCSEGLPLTLLEAMGAARPVVATSVGEVPGIIYNAGCGWLCHPSNPNELAKAMEIAALEKDLTTIGARGRKAVVKQYSVERMAQDYEHLYQALLSKRNNQSI